MSTTMDQRESLMAEFTTEEVETLFSEAVPLDRLDELLQILQCDIDAARVALRNELDRIAAETAAALPLAAPMANPIPL